MIWHLRQNYFESAICSHAISFMVQIDLSDSNRFLVRENGLIDRLISLDNWQQPLMASETEIDKLQINCQFLIILCASRQFPST